MSSIRITPAPLNGKIAPPTSKSDAHRALICAALAEGKSVINNVCFSEDIMATIDCIAAMGVGVEIIESTVKIDGGRFSNSAELNCRESGSTMRFIIPVAAALGIESTVRGKGRLPYRPMDIMWDLLKSNGIKVEGNMLPVKFSGKLSEGKFYLPGNISSQYVSGLLFALPLLGDGSEIILSSPLESQGYVDMTIHTMAAFGVEIIRTEQGFKSAGSYRPGKYYVEGDWSSAAFPIAAAALGGEITLSGLKSDSVQGDKRIVEIIRQFGATAEFDGKYLTVTHGELRGIEIDVSQIPDMVPALAVIATAAQGDTVIKNAGRLRLKESDRLTAVSAGLRAMGIACDEGKDYLIIRGGKPRGGRVNGMNDHRIIMAFSILASYAEGETVITDAQATAKSYPDFFRDFIELGGNCCVI